MGLEVYFTILSQPSRAVLMFLESNGIPYTRKTLDLGKGEHRTEEFSKINPMMKVPAISDGDFNLTESVAILKYLANKYNVADHWYPKDIKKRAKVDEYLAWHHTNTRPPCGLLFFTEIMMPAMTKQPVDTQAAENALTQLNDALDKLESMFLKDSRFLCGDEISIADLLGVCELMQALGTGRDVTDNHSKVKSWMERVRNRMNPYFDEVHIPINKIRQKRLKKAAASKL
ncbi:glutathione S-transferase theta-1-like [Glandiceps talaboti]